MFTYNINPVLFSLGPFEVRYYGLFLALSIIISYFILKYLAKERNLNLKGDDVAEFLTYLIIAAVIGARLFYIIFYNLSSYLQNPLEILMLWHGGLSFHGGLTGAVLGGYLFCRKYKYDFLEIADIAVIPLALGLCLGRIANFINGELYGRITNVPWAVKFPGADGFRHPSQLYEAAKNLIIFTVLWFIRNKSFPKGFLFGTFICMYSALRFFIEFFREADIQVGYIYGLTLGQVLNMVMFVIGISFIYRIRGRK